MKILYRPNIYSQQRQKEKAVWVYPVLMAMQAQYYREQGHEVYWGECPEAHYYDKLVTQVEDIDFLALPYPDRVWTDAFNKRYQVYGNYKYFPATHMMVADGCWHGKCTFCVENGRGYKVRDFSSIFQEISDCERLGFKEIFDDSGTFPDGKWLKDFCAFKKFDFPDIVMGCNMRIGADVDFKMIKAAGFRMILFGIESANQHTLDTIQKGVNADEIIPTIKKAAEAGLEPHIAVMFGYPWETDADAQRTLELVHYILRKGYAKTAQASFFNQKGIVSDKAHEPYVRAIYKVGFNPEFIIRKISSIRNGRDLKYLIRQIKAGIHDISS